MAQVSPQYCPRCGTEIVPQQNFCATCGLPKAIQAIQVTKSAEQVAPRVPIPGPGAPVFAGGPQAWHSALLNPIPASGKRRPGRTGIALLLIAFLLILIALGYLLILLSGLPGLPGTRKAMQAPITRTNINTRVTYASVEMTILNVQQAQNFLDDPRTTSDGMARLQIQVKNTLQKPIALAYNDVVHLIQPDGKEVAALYTRANPTLGPGATRTDSIDFALPTNVKIDKLSLRLGRANEAQLDIPLNGHADASTYAAKTVKIDNKLTYLSMNWTLVDASSQLSFNGRQASKGMRYVTITFNIDNPLTETIIPGSPYTYMHLKTATAETIPVDATMPVSLDPGVVGKTGSATFQISQESTSLTLNLSTQENSGFDPATTTFQL
ncbi:MAG: hypothetical protein NVSMB44_04270 [Ktedonobacteraceae bacterium]